MTDASVSMTTSHVQAPAAPLPEAGVGSSLGGVSVTPCDPAIPASCALAPIVPAAIPGFGGSAIAVPPFVWLGSPGNPKFVPLIGIAFPSFGLDFEACFLGAAVHLSPYGTGFIGLGLGC